MPKRKQTFEFGSRIAPGDTETETVPVPEDATVEEVMVRFYRGPELHLGVEPFVREVEDNDRKEDEPLVTVTGRDWIVGDDDRRYFYTDQPVERDDLVGFRAHNMTDELDADQQFSYDYVGAITVDYRGGTSSLFGEVASGLSDAVTGVLP